MSMNVRHVMMSLLMVVGLGAGIASCQSGPQKPVDETKNKLHDNPARAIFTLTEGRLSGEHFTATGGVQKVIYGIGKDGWGVMKESPEASFVVKGDKSTAYYMEIQYFNSDGEEITGQFVTEGQEKIHQHFFMAQDFDPSKDENGKTYQRGDLSVYDYVYLDTDPWNGSVEKGAKLVVNNPIGMKGAFHFLKPNLSFKMRIMLLHARGSKLNEKGVVSPFNRPTKPQIANQSWDIDVSLTFRTK